jgi:hypothetical protein
MAASAKGSAGEYSDGDLRTVLALHAIAVSEMAQGLCMLDAECRIVLFNPQFVETIGIRPDLVHLGVSMRVLFADSGKEENPPIPHQPK